MKNKITFLLFYILLAHTTVAQKKINASTILEDIKNGKTVDIKNATIIGVLDLTYMNEALPKLRKRKKWWSISNGNNEVKKNIATKLSFENCIFKDDVLAYIPDKDTGYTFTASFEDEIIFRACVFEQRAMFKYSRFEKDSDFSKSIFEKDNSFKYAKFDKNINFANTVFKEAATFKYSKFNKNVSFENSIFKGTASFKYTIFNDGVSFRKTIFEEDLNIKYLKVSGDFDITDMKVAYEIDSKYTKINGNSFGKYLAYK